MDFFFSSALKITQMMKIMMARKEMEAVPNPIQKPVIRFASTVKQPSF